MKITLQKSCIPALMTALILTLTLPSLADKPPWAENKGKGNKHDKHEKYDDKSHKNGYSQDHNRYGGDVHIHFSDQHRTIIRSYYTEQFRSGNCPPGLARKNNGCMPPGQAKKWKIGHPLPRDVVFYDLPPAIIVQLGSPPAGHRYVRVASDILLIAVGTGLIVDAIQDLNNM